MNEFEHEVEQRLVANSQDHTLRRASHDFMAASTLPKYCYNFSWLGRPIIQYPQDIYATQELIWRVKPDLVIETGIAHGGSLILSASLLAMLDFVDARESGSSLSPADPKRLVLGIDIDIRTHNKSAIESHPFSGYIQMIQASSIDPDTVVQVKELARTFEKVLVLLDSNHTHEHVLAELNAYAHLASVGSYCVVFDTIIDDLPKDAYPDRLWGPRNNPKTAAREFLKQHPEFEVDKEMDNKLQISVTPDGFLKRVR
jgi:cephalosporin hydroxylase